MPEKLFKEHHYISVWLILNVADLIGLIGWTVLSSGSFSEMFIPGYVIPDVIYTILIGIDWRRQH